MRLVIEPMTTCTGSMLSRWQILINIFMTQVCLCMQNIKHYKTLFFPLCLGILHAYCGWREEASADSTDGRENLQEYVTAWMWGAQTWDGAFTVWVAWLCGKNTAGMPAALANLQNGGEGSWKALPPVQALCFHPLFVWSRLCTLSDSSLQKTVIIKISMKKAKMWLYRIWCRFKYAEFVV